MRAPVIDFLPGKGGRRLLIAGTLLCWCLSVLFGYAAWRDWKEARELDRQNLELAQRINQLSAERDLRNQEANKPPPLYLADAQSVAKVMSFPLQEALHALEITQVNGVKVNSIDIHADQATVELVLEFTDYKALLAYVEALNLGEPEQRWKLRQATAGTAGSAGTATVSSIW
ncbi:hypothetical protein ACFJGW_07515 [Burkholderiaceae bacterium UC74_6]